MRVCMFVFEQQAKDTKDLLQSSTGRIKETLDL